MANQEKDANQWPKMEIADLKFALASVGKDDKRKHEEMLGYIEKYEMAPYYEYLHAELGWPLNTQLQQRLKAKNEEKLKELDVLLGEAADIDGESETKDVYQKRADYFCQIGDKSEAEQALRVAQEKAVGSGNRLDIVLQLIRLGFFFSDTEILKRNLEKAKAMVEQGGDWDRRNRLKVYDGLFAVTVRDFEKASVNFLDTVATFTCTELMSLNRFVGYCVLTALFTLKRNELKAKVIKNADILEVLHGLPQLRQLLFSFYKCQYETFFRLLADVEQQLKYDYYAAKHYHYFTREMRIKAYHQLLESYQSVRIENVAASFGVSVDFIDNEMSRFISDGRLACKMDKVNEIVITNRPDNKSKQYQNLITKGDLLLNKMQKLSRIVHV